MSSIPASGGRPARPAALRAGHATSLPANAATGAVGAGTRLFWPALVEVPSRLPGFVLCWPVRPEPTGIMPSRTSNLHKRTQEVQIMQSLQLLIFE
jgi:hypothetical protein